MKFKSWELAIHWYIRTQIGVDPVNGREITRTERHAMVDWMQQQVTIG
jgi:hypothetical protein